jgi:hypothetical protein
MLKAKCGLRDGALEITVPEENMKEAFWLQTAPLRANPRPLLREMPGADEVSIVIQSPLKDIGTVVMAPAENQ